MISGFSMHRACVRTSQNETADGRNEAREKRVERKGADQTAVNELDYTREQYVEEVRVNEL